VRDAEVAMRAREAISVIESGLSSKAYKDFGNIAHDWADMDRYIAHQVSQTHTAAMCRTVDIDPSRVPLTFPTRGNMGPATIPFTLATQLDSLRPGHRVLLMGAGSGMNAACVEVVW
jgi:3-oxoacyl-[acyl-carrier-protein] synthase-3